MKLRTNDGRLFSLSSQALRLSDTLDTLIKVL